MEWSNLRKKIIALHRFDVQPKLKRAGLPAGILPFPRFALGMAISELSPNAFAVFMLLYARLDFELKTHWVSGIPIRKIAEVLGISKTRVERAIKELKEKGYIHVVSGQRHQTKARALRKHVFGQAKKLGGNDYNAYSLLPFFVKLYMELEAQALEGAENENIDLPPDEEILRETYGDTPHFKPLGDNDQNDILSQMGHDTPHFKPLGDNDQNDILSQMGRPCPNRTSLSHMGQVVPNKDTTNEVGNEDIFSKDTHTNESPPAEKNRGAWSEPEQTLEPPPAERLPEPVYQVLVDWLSRQKGIRSPIAVLRKASKKEIEAMATEVLREWVKDDYDLREEISRIEDQMDISAIDLLEYVLLSEEGRIGWLEERGIDLSS